MSPAGIFRPGMRGYFIPFGAGLALTLSAFLPWVVVGDETLRGVPEGPGWWVVGLGAAASVLAMLSLVTRRNSRHPLLLVGLVALAIVFLSWKILPRTAGEHALAKSQASSIVENTPMAAAPAVNVGAGIYLGLAASAVVAGFGLTIVVRRAARPYAIPDPNDDVD